MGLDTSVRNLIRGTVREEVRDVIREEIAPLLAKADEPLLDAKRAAELLGMTPQAIRRAAHRGTIPVRRAGRRLRFSRQELSAWIAKRSGRR